MKILVVDDEKTIVKGIKFNLENEGYQVDVCYDGETAVDMARRGEYAVILLDLMMPKLDGLGACQQIRQFSTVPIIMLTARSEDADKLIGFESGADDYITKPFSFKEMVCRVNAQIRRYYDLNRPAANADRHFGALMISSERFEAKVNGEPLNLTAKEFKILDFLTLNQNQIFSKQKLIDAVWGIDEYIDENTVVVTIARLREKLEKAGVNNIVTIWCVGYKWQY